jgi:hypothetical protein
MKTTLFITLLLLHLISHGQLAKFENDSLIFINRDGNKANLSQLITYELSKVAGINSNASLGNFLGFSTTDNNLSFNYNFKGRNFGLFEIYAKGGINGGLTNLFNDSKLNNGITLGSKYHLVVGNPVIEYAKDNFTISELNYRDLKYQYELKKLKRNNEIATLQKEIQKKEKELISATDTLNQAKLKLLDAEIAKKSKEIIDSLNKIKETFQTAEGILVLELKEQRRKLETLLSGEAHDLEDNAYITQRDAILKTINSQVPIARRIQWFSAGFSITQESFQLFDRTLTLDKQIYKIQDLVPTFDIAFTRYGHFDLKPEKQSYYFSIGATIKSGNNLSSLDKLEIQTRDTLDANRVIFKSQTAYSGNYLDNQLTAKITLDYYNFVGSKDVMGFHLRATHDLGLFAPVSSARIGIILSAMKDKSSISNIEVFFGLNDLFKNQGENSLFGRNVFGIQTSFPF